MPKGLLEEAEMFRSRQGPRVLVAVKTATAEQQPIQQQQGSEWKRSSPRRYAARLR